MRKSIVLGAALIALALLVSSLLPLIQDYMRGEAEQDDGPIENGNQQPENGENAEPDGNVSSTDRIRVAAFNVQIFGRTKRDKPEIMAALVNITRVFDVVLIQEIRDSSETTAPIFLEMINEAEGPEYAFVSSPRLGRTSSKEAYAYFYNTETVQFINGSDHVFNDEYDVFEREPYLASFRSGNFDFTLVGIHTKPDDATHEIGNLTVVVQTTLDQTPDEEDIIVMGDFNADGSYFDEDEDLHPLRAPEYHWTVTNAQDTMTKTDWTYDRIVMTGATYGQEYVNDSTAVYYFDEILGITAELTWNVSDHYPVYAEFYTGLPDDDG